MVRGALRCLCALALAVLSVSALAAQSGQSAHDDSIQTLHVYPDLVEIPTLVLGQNHEAVPPIAESRFFVSINKGPKFRVTHARVEGNDPVSVSILLDIGQPNANVMGRIDEVVAALPSLSLTARDHLSVSVLYCQLDTFPVSNPTSRAGVEQSVAAVAKSLNALLGVGQRRSCVDRMYFWDAVTVVTRRLRAEPGLRVMLVISDGFDGGSKNTPKLAGEYAQESSVAIFGLTDAPIYMGESALNVVCQSSGGILLSGSQQNLAKQMEWFMKMVRGRYIVDFPHPVSTKPTHFFMEMTIAKSHDFIRPAGATVSVDDPNILNDPMTIRPDPSYAPQVGNRKVITPY
jgi:hypothetical protein